MDHLDLNCVSSFVVLAEEAHYGRAAARLHVTPSTLSKRIQRLERQVGVELVARDGGGVAGLTAAGAQLASSAPPLLAHANAVRATAKAGTQRLIVILGVLGNVGDCPDRRTLSAISRQFRSYHADVRILCRSIPFSAVTSSLLDGTVDVLWGAPEIAPRAIELTHLLDFQRKAVLASHHPLADAPELSLGDIVDLPMLYNPEVPGEWMKPFYLGDLRSGRDARLIEIDAREAAAVFRSIEQGHAVTTTTPQLAATLGTRLRALPLPDLPPVPFYAGKRRTDRRQPVATLVELLPRSADATEKKFHDTSKRTAVSMVEAIELARRSVKTFVGVR